MDEFDEIPPEKQGKQEELDLNFHTDMPVGEILRRTRVHYGQELIQIENVLRIRASQLEALETGDLSRLPGRVYAIGFVRSYSEYLGLDGDKMVHLFKVQHGAKPKRPDLSFPAPASESKIPGLITVGGSLFGLLVLIGFVTYMMFPKAEKNVIPTVPEELTQSQLNEAPALVEQAIATESSAVKTVEEAAPAQPETPLQPTGRIVLEIVDSSWVEIRNAQGAAILRQVLKPGDIYVVPEEQGLVMATGNAGGIKVKLDGRDAGLLGTPGQIKRRILLDPATLTSTMQSNG